MTIPADLVKLLNIKPGDPLNVDVIPGGFVTRTAPAAIPRRYTLAELLDGVDKKVVAALNTEPAWAREGAPLGRGIL